MNEFDLSTQIDILRHGECEGGHIFRGKTDVRLLEDGQAKMQKSCFLTDANWDIILSSPLQRCRLFSKQLSEDLGIPLEIDSRIREISFGDWDGQLVSKILQEHEQEMIAWRNDPTQFTPPNGESIRPFSQRILEFYDHLLTAFQGKKILLVTHGGVIRVLLAQVLGMPLSSVNRLDIPYACMSKVAVYHTEYDDVVKLMSHNYIAHD